MNDSKPRDLTSAELALSQSTAVGQDTAPMRTPPGTQLVIELLDSAGTAVAASPTAGPSQAVGSEGSGVHTAPLPL